MATTLNPARVRSSERIEPVQPSPTITTSLAGSLPVMLAVQSLRRASARLPFGSAEDADRRQRIAFVVALDPIPIVVARPGESDHLPADHVAVAAIRAICAGP